MSEWQKCGLVGQALGLPEGAFIFGIKCIQWIPFSLLNSVVPYSVGEAK